MSRNLKLSPFFAEQTYPSSTFGHRVMGTFPNGMVSPFAVPVSEIKPGSVKPVPLEDPFWGQWLTEKEADHEAAYLNRIHRNGRMDWQSAITPVIISKEMFDRLFHKTTR